VIESILVHYILVRVPVKYLSNIVHEECVKRLIKHEAKPNASLALSLINTMIMMSKLRQTAVSDSLLRIVIVFCNDLVLK